MAVELRHHPCKDIEDTKAIYLNGRLVGYLGSPPNHPINLIYPVDSIPPSDLSEIKAFCSAHTFGVDSAVASPPALEREDDEPSD